MSVSLYRKYRPQDFQSVCGQKAAVKIILNSISKSKVGHAYLFSGSRGCGKTSVARIFAKALNCLDPQNFEPCGKCKNCLEITAAKSLDVVEIDGASNNGVDEIRELKTRVALAPFSSRYKVYIIDEVHMLSTAAFNALLKTLEEPPEYVIFILATTEPHKVPVTIRSRCQHIPFHSISPEDIFKRLKEVCNLENVNADNDALWEIARQADGALRDALSLLEQVIAAGDVNLKNVEDMLGAGSRPEFERYITQLRSTDISNAYTGIKKMLDAGATPSRIFEELFAVSRDLWLSARFPDMINALGMTEQECDFLREEIKAWPIPKIRKLLKSIIKSLSLAKSGMRQDILAGLFVYELDDLENDEPVKIPERKKPQENKQIQLQIDEPAQPKVTPVEFKPGEKLKPLFVNKRKPSFSESDYDEKLKAEILELAHENNFKIFCGLLTSHMFERDEVLNIIFEDAYTFEAFNINRNRMDLATTLRGRKKICLYFDENKLEIEASPKNNRAINLTEHNSENQPEAISNGESVIKDARDLISGLNKFSVSTELLVSKQDDFKISDDDNDYDNEFAGNDFNDDLQEED